MNKKFDFIKNKIFTRCREKKNQNNDLDDPDNLKRPKIWPGVIAVLLCPPFGMIALLFWYQTVQHIIWCSNI